MKVRLSLVSLLLAVLCAVLLVSCDNAPADTTTAAPIAPITFATLTPDADGVANLTLPNATTEFSFRDEITVADGVSYTVSQDKYGQSTYTSKIVPLSEGDNVFYILVEEGDALTIYTFTIRRRATHTVTFDRADGSPIIVQQVEEGDTAVIPDVENPEEFLGWDNDATAPITSDVAFTALWREHTITYELGGAENISFHPTTYTVNDAFILWDLNRSGYKFLGWTLDGETVTGIPKGTTGDLTLVANWEIETYSISYHLGGGTNAAENPTTYTVEDTILLANPTRTGYKFLGWTFGGEYVTEIPAGRIGNIGIIANWEAITYTITYDLAGGTNDAENPATYTVNDTVALANPTRNGYKFLGWTLDGETITEIPAGSIGDVSILANWEAAFPIPSTPSEDWSDPMQ